MWNIYVYLSVCVLTNVVGFLTHWWFLEWSFHFVGSFSSIIPYLRLVTLSLGLICMIKDAEMWLSLFLTRACYEARRRTSLFRQWKRRTHGFQKGQLFQTPNLCPTTYFLEKAASTDFFVQLLPIFRNFIFSAFSCNVQIVVVLWMMSVFQFSTIYHLAPACIMLCCSLIFVPPLKIEIAF